MYFLLETGACAVQRGEGGKQDGGSLEAAAAVKNRCEKINEWRAEREQKRESPFVVELCWWFQPQVGEFVEFILCQRWVLAAANRRRSNTLVTVDTNSRLAHKLSHKHIKTHSYELLTMFEGLCGAVGFDRLPASHDQMIGSIIKPSFHLILLLSESGLCVYLSLL